MGTTPMVIIEVTEAQLYKAAEDLAQVQAEIAKLNSHCATLSARCNMNRVPDMTPDKLFETEFVELDITLADHMIPTLLCGGIFNDETHDKKLTIP
eukprot:411329-Ditylum_brightwellii.AAC.1